MRKPWYCWALHRYTLLPAIHFPCSYNFLLISNGPIKFGFIYLARNRLNACLFRIHNLLAFLSSNQGFETMNIYLIQRATVRQERCGILATNDRILRPNSSWQSSTDVTEEVLLFSFNEYIMCCSLRSTLFHSFSLTTCSYERQDTMKLATQSYLSVYTKPDNLQTIEDVRVSCAYHSYANKSGT